LETSESKTSIETIAVEVISISDAKTLIETELLKFQVAYERKVSESEVVIQSLGAQIKPLQEENETRINELEFIISGLKTELDDVRSKYSSESQTASDLTRKLQLQDEQLKGAESEKSRLSEDKFKLIEQIEILEREAFNIKVLNRLS
jgi:chromosome segregation ATPase